MNIFLTQLNPYEKKICVYIFPKQLVDIKAITKSYSYMSFICTMLGETKSKKIVKTKYFDKTKAVVFYY